MELGGPQQRLVLGMLAEAGGRVITTDQLIDRIWGDEVPDNARKTIQVHVSRLRKALGSSGAIETSGGGYRLHEDVEVDVVAFERLAAEARRIIADQPKRAAALLDEALGLWRGPAFADIRDSQAIHPAAVRLEELRLGVVEDRIDAEVTSGRAAGAVAELEALIEQHPERERLHALHMLALYRSGRQRAALAAYQRYKSTLGEEHGLEPSPELAALELQILRQDAALGPTQAVVARPASGAPDLPAQLTSFVGRDEELADVARLLEQNRLLTLTGTGGVGKTRLALEYGRQAQVRHPAGVWLVELAGLADAELVDDEVASALRADPAPGTPVADAVAATIGDSELLVILDNCEHLIGAVASLSRHLLLACPALRILATSRMSLGVYGEVAYPLPALPVPAAADLETAGEFDAVRLFAERAAAVRPFTLDAGNVGAVVAVCRRLDGIPLAIELAAAQTATLSPAQLTARLDQRFRILASAAYGIAERHQTLRATLDWSYDLLTEAEQLLFGRLSVFAGTFSLEAAEAVCSGEAMEPDAVYEVLSSLVRKSMVRPEDGLAGEERYRLLDSVRAYGAARIAGTAGAGHLPNRHAAHFVGVAEALQRKYRAGDHAGALAEMLQDEDNMRAALRTSLDQGLYESGARIVGAIGYLWYLAGAYHEGIEWCTELFAHRPRLSEAAEAAALHAYGTLLSRDQLRAAVEILERELELRRRARDPARLASVLNNLGDLLNDLGRIDEGKRLLVESIEQFRAAGEAATYALVSLGYGGHYAVGDHVRAGELFDEALAEATAAGDAYGVALATTYLGQTALHTGRLEEARALLEEARARFAELGTTPAVRDADFNLALVDRSEGRRATAAARLLPSLEAPDALWYAAAKYWVLQVAASLIDDLPAAARLLGVAAAYYERTEQVQPVLARDGLAATTGRVREALGSGFDAAFAEGRRMKVADAVEVARQALQKIAYS